MEELEEKEQVEEKEPKKKGSTFKVVLIAILLVGLSVACGWFANDFWKDMSKKDNTTKEEKNTKKEENKEEVKEEWKSLGTDISKVKDTYETIKDYAYTKNLPNGGLSLTKREVMDIVASKVQESDLIDLKIERDAGAGSGYLSYAKVETTLKKLFNTNYKIDTTPTCEYNYCYYGISGCTTISEYNESTKNFSVGWGPCDGHGPSGPGDMFKYYFTPLRKITDVQEKNNEIKIIEKAIYVSYNSSPAYDKDLYDVYSDVQHKNKIGQIEYVSDKNFAEDYLDKAGTITSLYHKAEDGSYYFVSSEVS